MTKKTELPQSAEKDPTWLKAQSIVQKELSVPTHHWRLLRAGWYGQIDAHEFVRLLGFSRVNPFSLVNAAEIKSGTEVVNAEMVEQAVQVLGIRYSSVVIGINFVCKIVLRSKPPPLWRGLLEEMMTYIELGYRVGSRVPEIGLEGGAIMGFAKHAGLALLLKADPKTFKNIWHSVKEEEKHSGLVYLENFGCEPYQVSALALQQLGYGTEISFGAACATGQLAAKHNQLVRDVLRWKAVFHWIDCLGKGRLYPGDLEMRNFFKEISPPQGQQRNVVLEALYAETAKVRGQKSNWTWHLPKLDYETTLQLMGLSE